MMFVAFVAALLPTCAGCQRPPHMSREPQANPPIHDPVVARQGEVYYVFGTGRGITNLESDDMKMWRFAGGCIGDVPTSIQTAEPDARLDFWAPDIIFYDGLWHIFYSVSRFGKNKSTIGHATNVTLDRRDPAYEWRDHDAIISSVPGRDDWNAIDPNVIIDDDGGPWLTFGSFWDGIKMVRLTPDLMRVDESVEMISLSRRSRGNGSNEPASVEAPFVFKHGDWYYLFVSFGMCCRGAESTYRVAVGRSAEVTGPYLDRDGVPMEEFGGTDILTGDGAKWQAVGHCAVATFDEVDYLFAHAYSVADGSSHLVILPVEWEDEWPKVQW